MSTSERMLQRTFVELADTLVDDYDVIGFLDTLAHRVTDVLEVAACGVVLVDHHGLLNLVAASDEDSRMLELVQLQNSEGPCFDCYHHVASVHVEDLDAAVDRWPRFAPAARDRGFRAVHALPMRLRDTTLGAMNLFSTEPQPLGTERIELAQALADVATIGIVHERTVHQYDVITGQLQTALNSRIVIEQAKGVLAERQGVTVDEAFEALRAHARSNGRKLIDVARSVVEGAADFNPRSDRG